MKDIKVLGPGCARCAATAEMVQKEADKLGVPMYSNAAGIIPVVEALLGKGAALGTVLAFMMSVIALSLPEMIILRKVLKLRLIAIFAGIVGTGILLVGYVFNAVL